MHGEYGSPGFWHWMSTTSKPNGESMELMSGALRPWLKTWYMGNSRTSWSTAGQTARRRVDAALLVQLHLLGRDLGSVALYFCWIARSSGCTICMRRCEVICTRKTGIRKMRMMMVSRMIEIPMSPVTL